MNTFDFIVLGLLALGGITGFQKGLLTGLSRFLGKIAAMGIAVFFHPEFLQRVEPIFKLREKLEPKIGSFLIKVAEGKNLGKGKFTDSEALIQPVIGEATIVLTDYVLKIGALLVLFILTALLLNLLIAVVITPLAKTLSFVNRGGGLAFGILSTMLVLCLLIGLMAPFLTTANPGIFKISGSRLYPWLIQGYEILRSIIFAVAGDFLINPLEAFPFFQETAI
jgi:uncharacterized membrane protein required for colicin V production